MNGTCESLAARAVELGAKDARMINTAQIVFDDRAFLKCRFGCNRWGRYWACPPNLALTLEQFMSAFKNYQKGAFIPTWYSMVLV